jgi:hypothetical protein
MSRADECSSVPNFIANRSSLAKSEILRMFLPGAAKCALYPKDNIRADDISGSSGSHSFGQNRLGSLFFDHVCLLVPPSP